MYLVGQGHEHLGPGTSMVQRINWTTGDEFTLRDAQSGLGCAAGCGCDGGCTKKGLGLFDSGLDLSGWGLPEMGVALLGLYMVFSTFSTTNRGYQRVRSAGRKRKSGAKKRRDLEYRKRKLDRDIADL
jgi:hypothetical protein